MAFEDWFKLPHPPPSVSSPSSSQNIPLPESQDALLGWVAIIIAVCLVMFFIYLAKHVFTTATSVAFSFFQFVVFYAILRTIESRFLGTATSLVQNIMTDFIWARFYK